MIRRNVILKDSLTKRLFITPEFNGDKEEFEMRKFCSDGCSKNWEEILKEFEGVKTLKEFKEVSERVQNYYYSAFGIEILPIEEIKEISEVKNDYVYLIEEGNIKVL